MGGGHASRGGTATKTTGAADYTKAMIDWADADQRMVYIRVTAALAIATLFVTQIPIADLQTLHKWPTRELFAGLGSLVLSAGLYFLYSDRTHLKRRAMVKLLKPNASGDADTYLQQVWDRWGWALFLGNVAFAAGFVLLALVLYALIAQR